MGVSILYDEYEHFGVLFCNTSDSVFSSLLYANKRKTIDHFLYWLCNKYTDPRTFLNCDNTDKYYVEFLTENKNEYSDEYKRYVVGE